ncbi:hypothetical protein PMAYCL1PPCAC_26909, partial [Pristionchus mayeri]
LPLFVLSAPADLGNAVPETPVAENEEAPTIIEGSGEESDATESEAKKDEEAANTETDPAIPEESAPANDAPVAATLIKTGAEATMKEVNVRFALTSDFNGDGTGRKRYTVKITNQSTDRILCGVTFTAKKTSQLAQLIENADGSISTEPLQLAPGKTANQFTYTSIGRT